MTAEQIRYWDGQGIEFGAHSRTHASFVKTICCRTFSRGSRQQRRSSALLGHPIVSFAYPYGDYDDSVRDLVRGEFDLAFSVQEGLNYLSGRPASSEAKFTLVPAIRCLNLPSVSAGEELDVFATGA